MAQLDKASDYESEDWGFESLQGYNFLLHALFSAAGRASGTKNIIPDGIRTHNLRLRKPTPCPFGHWDIELSKHSRFPGFLRAGGTNEAGFFGRWLPLPV